MAKTAAERLDEVRSQIADLKREEKRLHAETKKESAKRHQTLGARLEREFGVLDTDEKLEEVLKKLRGEE